MPHLYTDQTEAEIRARFIQKFEDIIAAGRAASYKEICDNIDISNASFNQVKSGKGMPTLKMLYNLEVVYKVPVESVVSGRAPGQEVQTIREQLGQIQEAVQKIEGTLPV